MLLNLLEILCIFQCYVYVHHNIAQNVEMIAREGIFSVALYSDYADIFIGGRKRQVNNRFSKFIGFMLVFKGQVFFVIPVEVPNKNIFLVAETPYRKLTFIIQRI